MVSEVRGKRRGGGEGTEEKDGRGGDKRRERKGLKEWEQGKRIRVVIIQDRKELIGQLL